MSEGTPSVKKLEPLVSADMMMSNIDLALFGQTVVSVTEESPFGQRVDIQAYFATSNKLKNFVPCKAMTATEVLERQKKWTAEKVPVYQKIMRDFAKEIEAIAIESLTRKMFSLVLKNPPRTMTRNEWKQARRWLREAERTLRERTSSCSKTCN